MGKISVAKTRRAVSLLYMRFYLFALLFSAAAAVAAQFDLQTNIAKARNGDPEALNALGEFYADGDGGKFAPNFKLAVDFWRKAAKAGNAKAFTNLGMSYYSGNGVERNVPTAVEFWNEGAKGGDAVAQYMLGNAYCQGISVMPDMPTAAFWWEKAAEQGNMRAQCNLAFAYAKGQGVRKRDPKKAFELWKKSAEQGHDIAQVYLALCYYTGDGVEKDLKKAVAIWHSAAEIEGNTDALYYLGVVYVSGDGAPKNIPQAYRYFLTAASRGHTQATAEVEKLRVAYGDKALADAARAQIKAMEEADKPSATPPKETQSKSPLK